LGTRVEGKGGGASRRRRLVFSSKKNAIKVGCRVGNVMQAKGKGGEMISAWGQYRRRRRNVARDVITEKRTL